MVRLQAENRARYKQQSSNVQTLFIYTTLHYTTSGTRLPPTSHVRVAATSVQCRARQPTMVSYGEAHCYNVPRSTPLWMHPKIISEKSLVLPDTGTCTNLRGQDPVVHTLSVSTHDGMLQ